MKRRILAESLAVLGFFLGLPGMFNPSGRGVFILLGGGMIAAGGWLRNQGVFRTLTEGGEEAETGSEARERMWPRWLVSVCAGLFALSFLPSLSHMPKGEEHDILLGF